jgi:class 3 adenylate cyclase
MSPETDSLAVLFADISQSTRIYDLLGDQAGQKIVSDCLSLLSSLTEQHEGTVVKTIGDEVMCIFPSADRAAEAAKAMHEALEQTPIDFHKEIGPPRIRVGLHMGPVIRSRDDVFGDAVNVAARMVALAKARQIVTTRQTVEARQPELRPMIRRIDKTILKGKRDELDVYELVWEQQEVTIMAQDPLTSAAILSRLRLQMGDQILQVDRGHPSATMGRHPDNDMVVEDVLVSRSHASVEYRRGRFVLCDHSTNGTYLVGEEDESTFVHRDEIPLPDRGIICLGRSPVADSANAIRFAAQVGKSRTDTVDSPPNQDTGVGS